VRLSSTPLNTPRRAGLNPSHSCSGIVDVLCSFKSCHPPLERLIEQLPRLQARSYSISSSPKVDSRPVRCGVPKGVEDGCRLPVLQAGHPRNGCKAVSGVARLQGVEGLGMAGLGETLGSPWIPLAIRAWLTVPHSFRNLLNLLTQGFVKALSHSVDDHPSGQMIGQPGSGHPQIYRFYDVYKYK
jgi:hypothetical protein